MGYENNRWLATSEDFLMIVALLRVSWSLGLKPVISNSTGSFVTYLVSLPI